MSLARPATGQVLPPNTADLVTQSMRCVNSTNGEKGLLMKLRFLGGDIWGCLISKHLRSLSWPGLTVTKRWIEKSEGSKLENKNASFEPKIWIADAPNKNNQLIVHIIYIIYHNLVRSQLAACQPGLAMCATARQYKRWVRLVDSLRATDSWLLLKKKGCGAAATHAFWWDVILKKFYSLKWAKVWLCKCVIFLKQLLTDCMFQSVWRKKFVVWRHKKPPGGNALTTDLPIHQERRTACQCQRQENQGTIYNSHEFVKQLEHGAS